LEYSKQEQLIVSVIGLGYVGLPLAVEFSKYREVIAYDYDQSRIDELCRGYDNTNELSEAELSSAVNLKLTADPSDLFKANCYIITVPTPVDETNEPDLSALISASEAVGKVLSAGDIVIFESTVFPGATEDVCAPVLAMHSGLLFSETTMPRGSSVFYLGYSPERINPGDKEHRITDIVKVVSGCTPEIASLINELYSQIITAGTYVAESIKVAEAAKVIENIQRDVNIALVNEFSIIFNKLDINTTSVLEAAGTKWNFLKFQPGLVGGHCIGVDPYYLTFKALQYGLNPEIILAGRKINENMSNYVSERILNLLSDKKIKNKPRVLVLGISFKENCPDIRNSKVLDLLDCLKSRNCLVDAFDPIVSEHSKSSKFSKYLISNPQKRSYDAIVLAVKHNHFVGLGLEKLKEYGTPEHVFFDIKGEFESSDTDGSL
jgi:UDP-N-acetyl-D-glucosamine/UDP-N-acetyl-D-galactosamine dehydrogenase